MSGRTGNISIRKTGETEQTNPLKGQTKDKKKMFCFFNMRQCLDQNDPREELKGILLVELLEKEKVLVSIAGSNPSF